MDGSDFAGAGRARAVCGGEQGAAVWVAQSGVEAGGAGDPGGLRGASGRLPAEAAAVLCAAVRVAGGAAVAAGERGRGGRDLDALDEAQTQGIAAALRAALDRLEAGAGSVAELEAALLGERGPG